MKTASDVLKESGIQMVDFVSSSHHSACISAMELYASQFKQEWVRADNADIASGSEVLFVYKGLTHNGYFEANDGSEMFSTNSGISAHKSEIEWFMPLPTPPTK